MNLRTDFDDIDQLIIGNDENILFVGIRRATSQTLSNFEVTAFDYNLNTTLWRYYDEVLTEGTDEFRSVVYQLVWNSDQGILYALSQVNTGRYSSVLLNQIEDVGATNRSTKNILVTAISYTTGSVSWRTLLGYPNQPSELLRAGYYRGAVSVALRSNTGELSGQDTTKTDLLINISNQAQRFLRRSVRIVRTCLCQRYQSEVVIQIMDRQFGSFVSSSNPMART
jgi:hypothetical protein